MPERVTREEKIIELAILKARETLEALRDGENTELDIVKIKRPKAKATNHGIKQNQIHANAGGEEFTSGKIKKGFDKAKMITSVRSARAFVVEGDRFIEKQMAKGVLNEEETRALNKSQNITPNLLGGQDIHENESSDCYISDIFEGKNIDESAKTLSKYLDKVELIKEIATSSSMRDSYEKGLRQLKSKLNNLNVHSLQPDSNLENIDEIFKDFEELLQSAKDKINSFTSS